MYREIFNATLQKNKAHGSGAYGAGQGRESIYGAELYYGEK